MSITNYTELQDAVMNWLDRSDLSSFVPDFIRLSETYFDRNLRCRQQLATATLTTTSGSASLPSDFAGAHTVRIDGSTTQLEPFDLEPFYEKYGTRGGGAPAAYAIEGNSIVIGPVDDTASVKLIYYQRIPALSVSNTTNWLLTAYPDLYLFGALAEAELFGVDQQNAGIWKARRDDTVIDVNMSDNFRYRGNSPPVRSVGVRP